MTKKPAAIAPSNAPASSPVGGLPAREAAFDIVTAALEKRSGLDEALARPGLGALAPRDRAFARLLAMTVLRQLGGLDKILDSRLRKPPPETVKTLLRLGLAQILWLGTPGFAAVSTTLALAETRKDGRPFKALINGVLRGLLRDPAPEPRPEDLAPDWLLARWSATYGRGPALQIAAMIAQEPATDLTLRDQGTGPDLIAALSAEPGEALAIEAEPEAPAPAPAPSTATLLDGGSIRVRRRGDVAEWPGFAQGQWWVQDAAAAIPARLFDLKPGDTVLDLCAAPGGKTLQLAAMGAKVTALDRSEARLKRLEANLARTGLSAEIVTSEAVAWGDERPFDAILIDAPCSATGTFRRQPDVLWAARPADIATLAALQSKLLDAAARRLRPGGTLVYCVCSLEHEEGEAQARAFLRRRPDFSTVPITAGEGGAPAASVIDRGWLRILPHHLDGGLDGFFIARLKRAD
jgi:16S rRNA (cytosine967-C5)-methyltransferase